eukprot:6102610-Ditylum_brightwellii.AAC.1
MLVEGQTVASLPLEDFARQLFRIRLKAAVSVSLTPRFSLVPSPTRLSLASRASSCSTSCTSEAA